ncbi:hypothetical protein ACOMHN_051133 [Nucella lapillus]
MELCFADIVPSSCQHCRHVARAHFLGQAIKAESVTYRLSYRGGQMGIGLAARMVGFVSGARLCGLGRKYGGVG